MPLDSTLAQSLAEGSKDVESDAEDPEDEENEGDGESLGEAGGGTKSLRVRWGTGEAPAKACSKHSERDSFKASTRLIHSHFTS